MNVADDTTQIVKEITINAPADTIFAALTEPDQLTQWWGEEGLYQVTHMETDLRVGGTWRSSGIGASGTTFVVEGVYRARWLYVVARRTLGLQQCHITQQRSKTSPNNLYRVAAVAMALLAAGHTYQNSSSSRRRSCSRLRRHFSSASPLRGFRNMHDIIQELLIAAPRSRVYEALTTANGIRRCFTRDADLDEHVGGAGAFRFNEGTAIMAVTVGALEPDAYVGWNVNSARLPGWAGTTIAFDLRGDDGATTLRFASLQQYLETGAGSPHERAGDA